MSETPACSPWMANILLEESARDAWIEHRLLGNAAQPLSEEKIKRREQGSILHAFLAGQNEKISVWRGNDFRSNEARGFRDNAREKGRLPVAQPKYEELEKIAGSLRLALGRYGYDLSGGKPEQKIEWYEDTEHGKVLCKGYVDWISDDNSVLLDFKTTEGSVRPATCSKTLETGTGCIQDVAYRRGVEFNVPDLQGRVQCIFLFCQSTGRNAITPVICGSSMRELGTMKWNRAVNIWAKCLAAGRELEHWPSHVEPGEPPAVAEASNWNLTQEMEKEY